MKVTMEAIREAAINRHNTSRYETRGGRVVLGFRVQETGNVLRSDGWKNVGCKFNDAYGLRRMGLEVVTAQYVNGARPTGRFIEVVVISEA
jgi:hypothetical protein